MTLARLHWVKYLGGIFRDFQKIMAAWGQWLTTTRDTSGFWVVFFFLQRRVDRASLIPNFNDFNWSRLGSSLYFWMRSEVHRSTHGMNTAETLFTRNTVRLLKLRRMAEGANTSAKRGYVPYFRYFSWDFSQDDLLLACDTQRNL